MVGAESDKVLMAKQSVVIEGLRQDIKNLHDDVKKLVVVVMTGNGQASLMTRLALAEKDIRNIRQDEASRREHSWQLRALSISGVLSWVGSIIIWALALL